MWSVNAIVVLVVLLTAGCMGGDLPLQEAADQDAVVGGAGDDAFHLVWVHGEETMTVEAGPTPSPTRCIQAEHARDENAMAHHIAWDVKELQHDRGQDLAAAEVVFAFDLVRIPSGCPLLHALYPDPLGSVPITIGAAGEYEFAWSDGAVMVEDVVILPGSSHAFHYNHTVEHGTSVLHYQGWFRVENHGAWPRDSLVSS